MSRRHQPYLPGDQLRGGHHIARAASLAAAIALGAAGCGVADIGGAGQGGRGRATAGEDAVPKVYKLVFVSYELLTDDDLDGIEPAEGVAPTVWTGHPGVYAGTGTASDCPTLVGLKNKTPAGSSEADTWDAAGDDYYFTAERLTDRTQGLCIDARVTWSRWAPVYRSRLGTKRLFFNAETLAGGREIEIADQLLYDGPEASARYFKSFRIKLVEAEPEVVYQGCAHAGPAPAGAEPADDPDGICTQGGYDGCDVVRELSADGTQLTHSGACFRCDAPYASPGRDRVCNATAPGGTDTDTDDIDPETDGTETDDPETDGTGTDPETDGTETDGTGTDATDTETETAPVNGEAGFCSAADTCGAGEGPCSGPSQCGEGLLCASDPIPIGDNEVRACRAPEQGPGYCADRIAAGLGKCEEGEGGCTSSSSHCDGDLECIDDPNGNVKICAAAVTDGTGTDGTGTDGTGTDGTGTDGTGTDGTGAGTGDTAGDGIPEGGDGTGPEGEVLPEGGDGTTTPRPNDVTPPNDVTQSGGWSQSGASCDFAIDSDLEYYRCTYDEYYGKSAIQVCRAPHQGGYSQPCTGGYCFFETRKLVNSCDGWTEQGAYMSEYEALAPAPEGCRIAAAGSTRSLPPTALLLLAALTLVRCRRRRR